MLIGEFNTQVKAFQSENQILRDQIAQLEQKIDRENEARKRVYLIDQPDYEDRVRSLLTELEHMSKQNQQEISNLKELIVQLNTEKSVL